MLRIMQRNPERIPMDRLGDYIREFAELLGTENQPRFKGIKKASTGLKAAIPAERQHNAHARIVEAKGNYNSKPGRHLKTIEDMLGQDKIKQAQLLDATDNVVYLIQSHIEDLKREEKLYQQGSVDGVVTGLVGADDTMHLHLRDNSNRDLKLVVRDENMARNLLSHFRNGIVRLQVHGTWQRTETGWIPDSNKCTVDSFETLEDIPLHDIFADLATVKNNGWTLLEDPIATWESIRGLH